MIQPANLNTAGGHVTSNYHNVLPADSLMDKCLAYAWLKFEIKADLVQAHTQYVLMLAVTFLRKLERLP